MIQLMNRLRTAFSLAGMLLLIDCASGGDTAKREWQVSEDLVLRRIAEGVWLHTSWRVLENGTRFPSNGLVVRDGHGVMLVDTAWGEEPTRQLLEWIDGTLDLPLTGAVITHSHDDRIGGAELLAARGVPLYSHPLTSELARVSGFPSPRALREAEQPGGHALIGPLEVFYPGPAHTRDNVIVWIPARRILFGGCAVRSAGSTSAGNLADAAVGEWPHSIRRAIARYPNAEIVVPGHGEPGDGSLLQLTVAIVEPLSK